MKVGVIGAGYWGKKHVEEYTKLGHDVFVSDLLKENRNFCEMNYSSKTFDDYNKILQDEEISSVSICTPDSTHKKIAIEALENKKNILVEKPLSTSLNDIDEILQKAKDCKKLVMCGHIFRFNNALKKVKEIIQASKLGKIFVIELCWTDHYPILGVNSLLEKDILFDQGVHPIDIVDFIFNKKPSKISCMGSGIRIKNPEYVLIKYHLDNGTNELPIVTIKLSWITPFRRREMKIMGSEKSLVIDYTNQKITLVENATKKSQEIFVEPNNALKDELEYFVNCCNDNKIIQSPYPNGAIGKRIVEILEKAHNSLQQNL